MINTITIDTTTTTTGENNNNNNNNDYCCKKNGSLFLLRRFCRRPRILYASTFVWLTCVGGRFLSPFLEHDAGLSSEQIGTALAIQQFSITIFSWMGGIWADRLTTTKNRNGGRLLVIGLGVTISTIAFLLHGLHHIMNRIVTVDSSSSYFWNSTEWHYVLQAIYGAAIASVFPVLDGITMDCCSNTTDSYGKERFYGPVFWAIASLSLSPLLDRIGFIICYPLAIVSTLIVYITLLWFYYNYDDNVSNNTNNTIIDRRIGSREFLIVTHNQDNNNIMKKEEYSSIIEREEETTTESDNSNDDDESSSNNINLNNEDYLEQDEDSLKVLLYNFVFTTTGSTAFLFCLVCISSGQAIVDNLSFLFFESSLGSSWFVLGLSVVVKILFELPIFYYDTYLLTKYGNRNILLLGCGAYIVRVIAYTWIPSSGNSSIILWLLEPLHGITYGAVQIAMVDFASRSCLPPGMEATGQGLVYFFREAGGIVGVGVGGWGLTVGPKTMFRVMAGIVLIGSLCMLYHRNKEDVIRNNSNRHRTTVSFGLEQQPTPEDYHNIYEDDIDNRDENSVSSSNNNISSIRNNDALSLREIT